MNGLIRNICLILMLVFTACQTTSDKVQKLHYSTDKLVAVISDLYLAEAALKDVKPEHKDSLLELYRNQISVIHEIDLELIEEDIAVAQRNLAEYRKIHSLVQDSIILREKKLSTNIKDKKVNLADGKAKSK